MGIHNLLLHCHSDQSIKDGAQTIKELVNRAKELGAPAVTLTDHGVLTGTFEFMHLCQDAGIKAIPGVEAYVKELDSEERRHLILLAKDRQGYKAIEKIISEGNLGNHLVVLKTKVIATIDKPLLKKYFGEGGMGHGHVIATSACVQGVIAAEINHNSQIEKTIEKNMMLRERGIDPNNSVFSKLCADLDRKLAEETELKEQQKALKKMANAPTKKVENYMNKRVGLPDYEEAKAAYDNLLANKAEASQKLESVQAALAQIKKDIKEMKGKQKTFQKDIDKYIKYDRVIQEETEKLLDDATLMENAKREAIWYRDLFGEGNFFIELQFHGYEDEAFVFPRLCMIAKGLKIPCVPANDAHYSKAEDARRRHLLVADAFNKVIVNSSASEEIKKKAYNLRPEDNHLYIKSDEELKDMLLSILNESDIDNAFENLKIIADSCNVELPFEEHYPKYNKLPEGKNDTEYIRELALKGIEYRYPNGIAADGTLWDDAHAKRLEEELKIIGDMGFNNYHLVVQDYLNYGKSLAAQSPEGVGYTIGPGRGSAVGSLVCYLLGITALDPIKYNLFFERYLNPERVTMPDIDADFANGIRDECIAYMKRTYGKDAVSSVTTKTTMQMKNSILLVGRVTQETTNNIARVRAITKAIPKGAESFNSKVDKNDPSKGTVLELMLKKFTDPVEQQIIKDAASIEGLTVAFGRHAAAVIISDTGNISDQVAIISNKDGDLSVQCVKEEAEKNAGLLKMDFLGLTNLDIITETLRKIARNHGIKIDVEKDINFEDEVFQNIFYTGNTDAVFQFASGGMKQMLKDFRPSCFEDLILLVAAYRPGPMQYLPDIIAAKHGRKKITYPISQLEGILNGTYGKTVYQEQVQEIFKKLAGYSLGQADLVRRAMSKKKTEKLEHERKAFLHGDAERGIVGCVANGIEESVANKLFDEMMDFASYAFNKSHAAAYAYVAYQTAWLKHHYPQEYMASVMQYSKYDKLPTYIFNCKNMGIKITTPDINKSQAGFIVYNGAILYGFQAMKGVGEIDTEAIIEERKKGEYKTFKSFLKRTDVSKDTFESLVKGGAFDCFNENREALLVYGTQIRELKKEVEKLKKKLEDETEKAGENPTDKVQSKLTALENDYVTVRDQMDNLIMQSSYEDRIAKLKAEQAVLSAFISDHPVNNYKVTICTNHIKDILGSQKVTICGLITNYRVLKTKKTGEEFCAFSLDDGTGSIDTLVWPRAYNQMFDKLNDGNVVCLSGNVKSEEKTIINDAGDEETEYVHKFYPDVIEDSLQKKQHSIVLSLKTAAKWSLICDEILEKYESESGKGFNLLIYDETFCQVRRTGKVVTSEIFKDSSLSVSHSKVIE